MALILHCADLHLGRRPVGGVGEYSEARFSDYFESFSSIAEDARARAVDAIIIAGDIFDRREISPEILERAEKIFAMLKDARIPVIITEGNHDRGGGEASSWLSYLVYRDLALMPHVSAEDDGYLFSFEEIAGIRFYSMGYPGIYAREMAEALAARLDAGKKNIVLIHTAIAAGDFFPGTVEPAVIDLFKGKAVYVAGGHFHTYSQYPKDDPLFFVPGSPEYWDLNEGDSKYYILFNSETGDVEKVKTKKRTRIRLDKRFDAGTNELFLAQFSAWLDEAAIEKGSIVVCRIQIADSLFPDPAKCERMIEERGALKARVSFVYGESSAAGGEDQFAVSTSKIESERLVESGLSPQSAAAIAEQYLPEFKKIQAEGNDDAFDEAFALFDRMLDGMRGMK